MTDVPDFDAVYRADPDPWRVLTSFYEQRKLEVVLASLGAAHYDRAWDPACGVGELAARLSERADAVLATDASVEAVRLTRARVAGRPTVAVRQLALPAAPGPESYDLVALCEFLYYLGADDRRATLDLLDRVVSPTGELLSIHWRHKPHDAWLSGAAVQDEIDVHLRRHGWLRLVHHEDVDFVLATHRRPADATSTDSARSRP